MNEYIKTIYNDLIDGNKIIKKENKLYFGTFVVDETVQIGIIPLAVSEAFYYADQIYLKYNIIKDLNELCDKTNI